MMQSLISRTAPFLLSAFLLSACGGGGGGGDIGTGGGGGGADSYSQQFNTYMPLVEGTSINYEDGTSGVVAFDSALSTSSKDIYSITYGEADEALTLLFESTPDAIKLYGIEGTFEASGATISKILFTSPLIILDGTNNTYAPTTAKAYGSYLSFPFTITADIDYTKSEVADVFSDTFGDGDLPVMKVTLNTHVYYEGSGLLSGVVIDQNLLTELMLTKGIGIVSHVGTYVGEPVNAQISSLTDLPEPIWFDDNGSLPVAISDTTFTITSQGPIRSENYKIANADEVNALGWITVQEDTASNTFNVTMQNAGDLPENSDLPVSVEVVFESLASGERMSANVTLVP